MPETPAPPLTIRPSAKPLLPHALVATILFVAAGVYIGVYSGPLWVLAVPVLYDLWLTGKYVASMSSKLIVDGDKLRYETGLLTKQTRTIPLAKIQDVGVQQSMSQRMLGLGAISIATAGDANRLVMQNVNDPTAACDQIMRAIPKH